MQSFSCIAINAARLKLISPVLMVPYLPVNVGWAAEATTEGVGAVLEHEILQLEQWRSVAQTRHQPYPNYRMKRCHNCLQMEKRTEQPFICPLSTKKSEKRGSLPMRRVTLAQVTFLW